MIHFRNLRLTRGAKTLVDSAEAQIHAGWRVGLTGANGSGKSSLLAMLRGQLAPDQGELSLPPDWVIAHVAQETPALQRNALDYVLDGDVQLREIEAALVQAEQTHDGERIGALHGRLGEIGGYAAHARAGALLDGLGFVPSDLQRPVADFSGGWRMRLNLAQALMCRSDLLLLDEPTNHLDLDAVIWLEQWLREYAGTLLLISHDRDFLDACVDHIVHIERGQLTLYNGGYTDFEAQRAEQLAQQQALYEKQQRQVAHMEAYINRFRAQATKARQAQSRIKALERMEKVAAAHVDTPFSFSFRACPAAPDPLLRIEEGAVGYGDQPVLDDIDLTLRPGERIGLLGRNGAGKSTLIKMLAGERPLMRGDSSEGKGLAIGYFAQHQLETLRPDESPLQHMLRLDPGAREQVLRNYLGGFDFKSDALGAATVNGASTPCGSFSGGEKSRLALALLIWQQPNLLLLDEPTNHLDLEMRLALTDALQAFEGAMVIVSHDRALLRATCDRFLLVDDGRVTDFDGDLDDYRNWLASRRAEANAADRAASKTQDKSSRKAKRARAAAERQAALAERRPLIKERERLERQLDGWQQQKSTLDQRLADSGLYAEGGDAALLQDLLKQQAELAAQIETAETRWLELEEQIELLSSNA